MANQRTYEVKSLGAFLFKIHLYMRHGYLDYYSRSIPPHKSFEETDRKLVLLYDVTFNRSIRARRRKQGLKNVMYIRYKSEFILLATHGENAQFNRLKYSKFSTIPFHFHRYSVGVLQGKPHIQLAKKFYIPLRKRAEVIALYDCIKVEEFLREVSPYSYRGVTEQRWKLYKLINQKRKKSGLIRIQWEEVKGK